MGLFLKQEEEIIGVLEISSGYVSGIIMIKNAHGIPLILASSRKEYKFTQGRDVDRLQRDMCSSLLWICEDIQKKTHTRPSRIVVVMASPWSYGEIRSLRLQKEKEFLFTQAIATNLIAEEVTCLEKERLDRVYVIDKKIIRVHLNGYTVQEPYGRNVRHVELDVFMSSAPRALLHTIEDTIHRIFKTKIVCTSGMMSDFIFARDMVPPGEDFLGISIHGEMTELTVIKSGATSSTAFFPLGTRSVIRDVAAELHVSVHEGRSLMHMYATGTLDEYRNPAVVLAGVHASLQWCTALKKVLNEMLPIRHMPSRVVVMADELLGTWLAGTIHKKFFPEFTTSHQGFDVIICDIKMLHQFFRVAEGVRVESGIITKSIVINRI